MSTPVAQSLPTAAVNRPFPVRRTGILLLGVIAIPLALSAVLNSYGPLTEDSASEP